MSLAFALAAAVAAQVAPAPATPPEPIIVTSSVDPARLAAAEKAVLSLVPPGTYLRMMRDQMPRMVDAMMAQMMARSPADLGLPTKVGAPMTEPLGAAAARQDPAFQERLNLTTKVMFEEMGTVFDRMEPRIRTGLARAFARKFSLDQLNDLNAFFATPTGAAFARDYLLTFMDPEVMQEMIGAMPELLKAMPAILDKAEKATAHLPPPPKPAAKPGNDR